MGKPRMVAEFLLDENKLPRTVRLRDGGLIHYKVRLYIENLSKEVYAVTYSLHESFINPLREVRRDSSGMFSLEISTYGDFVVQARIRAKVGTYTLAESVSRALEAFYGANAGQAIKDAIQIIKSH
jgi:hypothetical protein